MRTVWILTSEHNDYDQHGEYFLAVYDGKPSVKDLEQELDCTEELATVVFNGGGRKKTEDVWYYLREVTARASITSEVIETKSEKVDSDYAYDDEEDEEELDYGWGYDGDLDDDYEEAEDEDDTYGYGWGYEESLDDEEE